MAFSERGLGNRELLKIGGIHGMKRKFFEYTCQYDLKRGLLTQKYRIF